MHVSRDFFEYLVRDAVMGLPNQFLSSMDNVSIIVADQATPAQKVENGLEPNEVLYGLYEGVPLTERGGYAPSLPDLITIFQYPIEAESETMSELKRQVVTTVKHEVAHYFGFSDSALDEMGLG
ncbi:MAG: metallopeptidase family protein [SAR202 cluster bacterium]|nr:metallopeptidase family protein [SAR202 cluster bacterium]|tara:strand:- start:1334 stop:1705 length:372 start_codon:yes stop_codon:yes gene_type:complete